MFKESMGLDAADYGIEKLDVNADFQLAKSQLSSRTERLAGENSFDQLRQDREFLESLKGNI